MTRFVLVGLAVVLAVPACGGSAETAFTQSTETDPSASFAEAAEGPHRYSATHENLGVCEGAAEDGEETIELVFGPDGLTFTNLTYEWTQEYGQVTTNEYYRLHTDQSGIEWHMYVTLTADGLILYSETTDPESGGQADSPAPCYRYTYTRLD